MLQDQGKAQELSDLQFRILDRVEEILDDRGRFQYTADMIKAYTTEGGLLELDGEYTVFGEIVDGFDVLDSISRVYVNLPSMRPADDIWMVIKEE
jgi:cyclophilin family peptidyl-prolyl cis-trans isomerase